MRSDRFIKVSMSWYNIPLLSFSISCFSTLHGLKEIDTLLLIKKMRYKRSNTKTNIAF
jgi:hypothetical protein